MKTKKILFLACLLLFHLAPASAEDPEPTASLKVDRKQKIVEVIPASKEKFPFMRVRLPRKNDRALELRLHAIEPDQGPLRYRGTFHEWDGNMAGIQVEVSFDQKTWRRIKSLVK